MSWDDEDEWEANTVIKDVDWDEEDKESKDSWEDDEEKPKSAPKPKKAAASKGKAKGKVAAKAAPVVQEELTEKQKQERQKEEEEAHIKDLIGNNSSMLTQLPLIQMNPQTEVEFFKFASLLSERITQFESNPSYVVFLKDLIRKISPTLTVDHLTEISTSIEVIKKEKTANDKKKPKKKKVGVKVAIKSKDLFDDDAGGVNNDDDYDMFA